MAPSPFIIRQVDLIIVGSRGSECPLVDLEGPREGERQSQSSRSYCTGHLTKQNGSLPSKTTFLTSTNRRSTRLNCWAGTCSSESLVGQGLPRPWWALDEGPTSLFCLTRNALTSSFGPTGVSKICILKMVLSYCTLESVTITNCFNSKLAKGFNSNIANCVNI